MKGCAQSLVRDPVFLSSREPGTFYVNVEVNESSSVLCHAWKNASTVLAKFLQAGLEFSEHCSVAAAKGKKNVRSLAR